jgi:hypothetical protein
MKAAVVLIYVLLRDLQEIYVDWNGIFFEFILSSVFRTLCNRSGVYRV